MGGFPPHHMVPSPSPLLHIFRRGGWLLSPPPHFMIFFYFIRVSSSNESVRKTKEIREKNSLSKSCIFRSQCLAYHSHNTMCYGDNTANLCRMINWLM